MAFSPILSLPVKQTTTTTKPPDPMELPVCVHLDNRSIPMICVFLNLQRNLEYERYLKEVVEALESDAEFRTKLNAASEDDIRTGNIAHELEFVSHHVRSKLDEIKREEIERLRALVKQQVSQTLAHHLIDHLI